MKKNIKIKLGLILGLLPQILFAQQFVPIRIYGLIQDFYLILLLLPRLLFGLSVVYFFWGTGQFILNAGDEKNRADGKNKMIWGIVALTVFVSIYGILNLLGVLIRFTP